MANFQSQNKGTWFYYNPDDESQGGVCLRELSTEENLRIEKLTVKTKQKIKRGIQVEEKKIDEELAHKLRWDYCIVDWSKTCLDSQELECTKDSKLKMMKVTDFVKFVVDSLSELVDTNKSIDEVRVKNSESSSNGNQENQTAKSVENYTKKKE